MKPAKPKKTDAPEQREYLIRIHNDDGTLSEDFFGWATDVLSNPEPKKKAAGSKP